MTSDFLTTTALSRSVSEILVRDGRTTRTNTIDAPHFDGPAKMLGTRAGA